MATAVLLNASFLSQEALKPFAGGASALERVLALAASLPDVRSIRLSGHPEGFFSPGGAVLPPAPLEPSLGAPGPLSGESLAAELEEAAKGADNLFVLFADAPLVDPALCASLWKLHLAEVAEYSFADGYPEGLAPEIVRTSIVPILKMLAAGMREPGGRDLLFSILQKDINGFDIETEISPVDLRPHRLSLTCDSRRNRLIAQALHEAGMADAEGLNRLLPQRRDLLRSLPAYLSVQVAAACPQACPICPYPRIRKDLREAKDFMPPERFEGILSQMEALSPDAVVSPSLWGECALHPRIVDLVDAVLRRPGFGCLIETSGIGWGEGSLETLAGLAGAKERIDWILSLDAATEATYRLLRGEGMAEALRTADRLLSLFPGRVHAQAVRVKENEGELEAFHKAWKERGAKVIIQKHDDFCGFQDRRKLVDLSPLVRHECWHLKRNVCVLIDGTVPLCREDLGRSAALGDAFSGGLAAAWESMGGAYRRQIEGAYEGPCSSCDEYYTYNF